MKKILSFKILLLLTVLVFVAELPSCKKNDSLTQGQIMAADVEKDMKKGDYVYIYDYANRGDSIQQPKDGGVVSNVSSEGLLSIENGSTFYNLNLLKSYYSEAQDATDSTTAERVSWFLYF